MTTVGDGRVRSDAIDVCALEDVRSAGVLEVAIGRRRVALTYVDGDVQAFHGGCPHRGGPLGRGRIACVVGADSPRLRTVDSDRRVLMCPWHGWEFSLPDGQAIADPAVRLTSYPVEVRDGRVLVNLRSSR
jgi:nitrite reductase/ring-hydroxylating ferredoxin subunit